MSLCHLLDCYLEHNGNWWEESTLEENLVLPRRGSQNCFRYFILICCGGSSMPASICRGKKEQVVCVNFMILKIGGQNMG